MSAKPTCAELRLRRSAKKPLSTSAACELAFAILDRDLALIPGTAASPTSHAIASMARYMTEGDRRAIEVWAKNQVAQRHDMASATPAIAEEQSA